VINRDTRKKRKKILEIKLFNSGKERERSRCFHATCLNVSAQALQESKLLSTNPGKGKIRRLRAQREGESLKEQT